MMQPRVALLAGSPAQVNCGSMGKSFDTSAILRRQLSLSGFLTRSRRAAGRARSTTPSQAAAIVRSGAGREAAAAATEALIAGHRPKLVISAGFAGGLDDELKRHDILMVDDVVDVEGARVPLDLRVDADSLAKLSGVHVGRLLTVDSIIAAPEEKAALGKEHGAAAVDMETIAVATVCRERKAPFMAVRVIGDAVGDRLPDDVERLLHKKTTPGRLGAAAGAIFRRPSSMADMLRLKENALVSSERLAKFLAGMVDHL